MPAEPTDASSCAVYVVPIAYPEQDDITRVVGQVSDALGIPISTFPSTLDHRCGWRPLLGQCDSMTLLRELVKQRPSQHAKVVAITDVDLCNPVLSFVFGEAQLAGSAAVVSAHRLRNQFYGLPADLGQFAERLGKVVVHELGHLFGLTHCPNGSCVMHAARFVEEVDIRSMLFCSECRLMLRSEWGLSPKPGWTWKGALYNALNLLGLH